MSWRLVSWERSPLLLFSRSVVSNSFVTPQTVAHQASLSTGFPRQEYWSGLPCPPLQGIFPTQGLNLHLPHQQVGSLPLSHLGSAVCLHWWCANPQLRNRGDSPSLPRGSRCGWWNQASYQQHESLTPVNLTRQGPRLTADLLTGN